MSLFIDANTTMGFFKTKKLKQHRFMFLDRMFFDCNIFLNTIQLNFHYNILS